MREIKFRGKRHDNNEWVYGPWIYELEGCLFIREAGSFQGFCVDPKTVGQYIGVKDMTGREVYENDRVVVGLPTVDSVPATVRFGEGKIIVWGYDDNEEPTYLGWYLDGLIDCNSELVNGRLTIVGNIHE